MAPTTLLDQKTTTTPYGRDLKIEGYPIKISEMLALVEGAVYIERTAVSSPRTVRQTKRAVMHAFQTQLDGRGFSLVEVLSACPTHWRLDAPSAMEFIDQEMAKVFPLGVVRDHSP